MKSYKIVLFIFLIIAALGVVCAVFPPEGITIGSFKLRFPTLEKVLVRNHEPARDIEKEFKEKEIAMQDSLLNTKLDSINYLQELVTTHITRFYFPNDDITYFDALFKKMENAKRNKEIVRVLHYGDSQIELDRISSNLRNYFQENFGGGGPGLLPVVKSIPTMAYIQSGSGDFVPYTTYGEGSRSRDGDYGLMAKAYQLNGHGSFALTANKNQPSERLKQYSLIRLIFNDKRGDLKVSLRDKDHKRDYELESPGEGFQVLEWKLDTPIAAFSLNMSGFARIYGVLVDDGYGVSVDNVPMRGCSGTIFTQITDTLLSQTYETVNVGLIIMQYGGNSMPGMSEKGVPAYAQRIGAQIRYFHNVYPTAKILFIGPSDMSTMVNGTLQTYPLLPKTVEALKEVVLENGAAFWDMYEVMGGENSMIAWVKSGWAGNDYVHFTGMGANKIGSLLTNSFSQLYQLYLMEQDAESLRNSSGKQ